MIVLQEKRREEEEAQAQAQAQANMQLAQLAAHAKIAKDLSNEVLGKKFLHFMVIIKLALFIHGVLTS